MAWNADRTCYAWSANSGGRAITLVDLKNTTSHVFNLENEEYMLDVIWLKDQCICMVSDETLLIVGPDRRPVRVKYPTRFKCIYACGGMLGVVDSDNQCTRNELMPSGHVRPLYVNCTRRYNPTGSMYITEVGWLSANPYHVSWVGPAAQWSPNGKYIVNGTSLYHIPYGKAVRIIGVPADALRLVWLARCEHIAVCCTDRTDILRVSDMTVVESMRDLVAGFSLILSSYDESFLVCNRDGLIIVRRRNGPLKELTIENKYPAIMMNHCRNEMVIGNDFQAKLSDRQLLVCDLDTMAVRTVRAANALGWDAPGNCLLTDRGLKSTGRWTRAGHREWPAGRVRTMVRAMVLAGQSPQIYCDT